MKSRIKSYICDTTGNSRATCLIHNIRWCLLFDTVVAGLPASSLFVCVCVCIFSPPLETKKSRHNTANRISDVLQYGFLFHSLNFYLFIHFSSPLLFSVEYFIVTGRLAIISHVHNQQQSQPKSKSLPIRIRDRIRIYIYLFHSQCALRYIHFDSFRFVQMFCEHFILILRSVSSFVPRTIKCVSVFVINKICFFFFFQWMAVRTRQQVTSRKFMSGGHTSGFKCVERARTKHEILETIEWCWFCVVLVRTLIFRSVVAECRFLRNFIYWWRKIANGNGSSSRFNEMQIDGESEAK